MTLLRLEQAAEQLAVSVKTVERAINTGDLACVRIGARGIRRIHPDDLDAYIESRRVTAEPPARSVYRGSRVRASRTGSFREQLRSVS